MPSAQHVEKTADRTAGMEDFGRMRAGFGSRRVGDEGQRFVKDRDPDGKGGFGLVTMEVVDDGILRDGAARADGSSGRGWMKIFSSAFRTLFRPTLRSLRSADLPRDPDHGGKLAFLRRGGENRQQVGDGKGDQEKTG